MTEISFKSAGVSARVINLTGPTSIKPTGIPAGVIGTSKKGPAFVPVTVATAPDFVVDFGEPTNNAPFGPSFSHGEESFLRKGGLFLAAAQFARQPCTCVSPMTVGSCGRDTQSGSGLFDVKTGEVE